MPYLNLDINYCTNVKTRRLICLLGPGSEMLPIRLWCHCASHHAEDGVLEGYSVEEIEFFLDWKGPRGKAVATLLKVGFLDPLEHGFRVHNWMVHEGHISEFKRRSRIANASRWKNARVLAEAGSRPILKNPPEENECGSRSSNDTMSDTSGETRTPSGTPSDRTRTPSKTPCGETRTPSSTPGVETWSPPTKPTNTHTTEPSVFTYINLSNQTTQRQGADLCTGEPAVGRVEDSIKQTIFQQMGPDADLSEGDVETMVALSKIHGLAFQKACEHLRPGVKNIVGYVRTLLDLPKVPRLRSISP